MSKETLTIIVPTYNEAPNVEKLIAGIEAALKGASLKDYEVLIMDDDSPDGTADIVNGLGKENARAINRRGRTRGLSNAVLEGFREAKGSLLSVMDADLSHPTSSLPDLIRAIEDGANLAVASRYVQGGSTGDWPLKRVLISKFSALVSRTVTTVKDSGSGYFMLRRSVYEHVTIHPRGFKIGLELIVRGNHQGRVVEVPYEWNDRKLGESKLGLRETVQYLLQLFPLITFKYGPRTSPPGFGGQARAQTSSALSGRSPVDMPLAYRIGTARGPAPQTPGESAQTLRLSDVCIVIPAYNEEKRLSPFLEQLIAFAERKQERYEIIVVDDGSTDGTRKMVQSYGMRYQNMQIISIPRNQGKGEAVRRGVLHSRKPVRVFVDADGSYGPEEIEKKLAFFRDSYEIVIADRFSPETVTDYREGIQRKVMRGVFVGLVNLLLYRGINDIQCGFKMFRGDVADRIFPKTTLKGFGLDVEILFVAKRMQCRIKSAPVHYAHRAGTSVHVLRDSLKLFANIFQIRWRAFCGRYAS